MASLMSQLGKAHGRRFAVGILQSDECCVRFEMAATRRRVEIARSPKCLSTLLTLSSVSAVSPTFNTYSVKAPFRSDSGMDNHQPCLLSELIGQ